MSARPGLEALAARLGILPVFTDLTGEERRTSDTTREALVAAMGHDGSTEEAARDSLAELSAHSLIPGVQVWREHAARRPRVELHAGPGAVTGRLELHHEDGRVIEARVASAAGSDGVLSIGLPGRPREGYHRVRVELDDGRVAEQRLVVAPRTAPTAAELLAGRRAFGISANLYSIRSERGFGFGDMRALDELVSLVGDHGGDFVVVNPLHALRNCGEAISPYSPVSRLWRSLLYVDVERIAERLLGEQGCARLIAGSEAAARALRAERRIDYGGVLRVKLRLLRELHAAFLERERPASSDSDHARFVREGGRALRDHATFEALAEHFADEPDWRRWPRGYRDPDSALVGTFRAEHSESVGFHCWIQFELDCQLAGAARLARASGQAVGLVTDLAVGSPPDAADAWAHSALFAAGTSLGAPPDGFAHDGQNWGLAPIDPNRLRSDGFRFWTQLLRAALRHAGGLRIDHAIGLERAFWIPDGEPSSAGAYVRQPADELLGVLALEARRAGALVIGEDLGVVPLGLRRRLASWGLLSTSVLLFERDAEGFLPPEHYSPRSLVTATTHDLVPLDGWVEGTDLVLRGRLEQQAGCDLAEAVEARRRDVEQLARALDDADAARPPDEPDEPDEHGQRGQRGQPAVTVDRVHSFLARTPAPLLALSLDDLAGEREPINLPGISTRRHPSWSRRMTRTLAEIDFDPQSLSGRARAIGSGSRDRRPQDSAP